MKIKKVLAIAIAVMTMVAMTFTTTVFADEPQADPQDNAVVATDEEVEATEAVEQEESTPAPDSEAVEATEEAAQLSCMEFSGHSADVQQTGSPDFAAARGADISGAIALHCYGAHYVEGSIYGFSRDNYDYVKILRSLKKTKKYKVIKTITTESADWGTSNMIYFTDTKVKAGKKYYYKVRGYKNGVSGYDTLNYTSMYNWHTGTYSYPFKVTTNSFTLGKSAAYGTYTVPLTVKSIKCYYSKGRLVAKVKFHNEFKFKIKKLTNFELAIYDYEGNVVASQTFSKKTLNVKKKKFKTVTFKFSKSNTIQGLNLRDALNGGSYNYDGTFSY